jgi:chemotaxis protein MotA
MNFYSIAGLVVASTIFVVGLRLANDNLMMFIDYPSMFIVVAGTFAASVVSFQFNRLSLLFKIFLAHFIGGHKIQYASVIANVMIIGESYRNGQTIDSLTSKADDPFLREALELIGEGFLEPQHVVRILEDRMDHMNYLRTEDATKVRTLSQFPPAFGMMGTTIGMIVLLANLGGEDAMKMIGPAMGVCLITTLYGTVLANLIFIPIGENLIQTAKSTHRKNQVILEGVRHIIKKSNPILVAEELNSFLLPKERLDWKDILKG